MTDNGLNINLARNLVIAARRRLARAQGPYEIAAAKAHLEEAERQLAAYGVAERG
jgi:hypothetical protein